MKNTNRLQTLSSNLKTAYGVLTSSTPRVTPEFQKIADEYQMNVCFGCSGASGLQNLADTLIMRMLNEIRTDFSEIAIDCGKYVNYIKLSRNPNPIDLLNRLGFKRLSIAESEIQRATPTFRNSGFTSNDIAAAIMDLKLVNSDRRNFILSDLVKLYTDYVDSQKKVSKIESQTPQIESGEVKSEVETVNTEKTTVEVKPLKKKSNKKS